MHGRAMEGYADADEGSFAGKQGAIWMTSDSDSGGGGGGGRMSRVFDSAGFGSDETVRGVLGFLLLSRDRHCQLDWPLDAASLHGGNARLVYLRSLSPVNINSGNERKSFLPAGG